MKAISTVMRATFYYTATITEFKLLDFSHTTRIIFSERSKNILILKKMYTSIFEG